MERIVEVAWAFFLHAHLLDALLHGDVIRSVAWCMRFLGVGEPWSLRRIQELVITALEVMVEHRGGLEDLSAGALQFLHESCETYLGVPIIPRFQGRLRKSVSGLCESGIFKREGSRDDPSSKTTLDTLIASILDVDSSSAAPQQFDETGKGLEAFRKADNLHAVFRRTVLESVFAHAGTGCTFDAYGRVMAGAEASSSLQSGASWIDGQRQEFLEVISCVPQAGRRSVGLAALEEPASGHPSNTIGVGLEDVMLDLHADLQDGEVSWRNSGRGKCGICCTTKKALAA